MIKSADLFYQGGGSDKEYHIQIIDGGDSSYRVECQWGRVGNTLQTQTKVSGVVLEEAEKVFLKVYKEKVGKGYIDKSGDSGVSYEVPVSAGVPENKVKIVSGGRRLVILEESYIPQLLNPIDEGEVEKYLRDDDFSMQEKKDGKHIIVKVDDLVRAYNKKGKEVGYPSVWLDSLRGKSCVLDGEAIGDLYYVFDMLEVGGKDYRGREYMDRYGKLMGVSFGENVRIVPLAVGYAEKLALYESLLKGGKEGVVFKRLSASYKPGKAHSDMVKFKFYSEASVIVLRHNVKNSVAMGLYDESGKVINVGNVTMIGHERPPINSVIEVRYLYAYKGGCLYQPSYKAVRDDVDMGECVISQLKYKSSEEE